MTPHDPFVHVRGAREHDLKDVDVAAGPPDEVARAAGSRTARYLAERVEGARSDEGERGGGLKSRG
jgi:hypothetical protein